MRIVSGAIIRTPYTLEEPGWQTLWKRRECLLMMHKIHLGQASLYMQISLRLCQPVKQFKQIWVGNINEKGHGTM